jgi:hypothetical protein
MYGVVRKKKCKGKTLFEGQTVGFYSLLGHGKSFSCEQRKL